MFQGNTGFILLARAPLVRTQEPQSFSFLLAELDRAELDRPWKLAVPMPLALPQVQRDAMAMVSPCWQPQSATTGATQPGTQHLLPIKHSEIQWNCTVCSLNFCTSNCLSLGLSRREGKKEAIWIVWETVAILLLLLWAGIPRTSQRVSSSPHVHPKCQKIFFS